MLQLKFCLESNSNVIELCAHIRFNDVDVINMFCCLDVHCKLSRLMIGNHNLSVNTVFNRLHGEGLINSFIVSVLFK